MDRQWKARWIMDKDFYGLAPINVFHRETEEVQLPPHREELKNRHMLIRKVFNINSKFKNAHIDITADDYYKLYINGKFVGQGPAPGYYFHYNYNRYDITSYLKEGKNIIAVHVYYQGLINRVWNSGDLRQGMIAELYLDGEFLLGTDRTWKYKVCKGYRSGGTIGYDTQYLENIDSSLLERGWRNLEYDDKDWQQAQENDTFDHKLYLQETPPLEVYTIKPKQVVKFKDYYFIDFGEEITGQFKMRAKGNKGDVIEIRCGEELQEDGRVRYKMRCNCNYQEFWTLSGDGVDELEFYDYKGFRYVEVIAPQDIMDRGVIDEQSFLAVVRHYPLDDDKLKFSSSDELVNKIWNICKNGVKYGAQENYVDCPTREKGQYGGDVTVAGHSHIYVSGDLRLYKKAIKDFALSSFVCPGLLAVAPGSLMQEIADYSMQWPMQLLTYYMHSGDIEFLKEMYPICENILDYFKQYERDDGLLEEVTGKWNLVDWPQNLRDGYDFKVDAPIDPGVHNVINAFYYGMMKTINEIRNILGIDYDKAELEDFRKAFIKVFYNNKTGLYIDSEGSQHSALHSNVLPLFFDLIPDKGYNTIVDFIKKKGLSCGVYMAYFVLKALAKAGEHEFVYDLINSDSPNSWGNMVKEGATTCFEAWGKDQKWNTSLCHPWASAPIPVLIEDIIGLSPAKPGWTEIRFEPHIPSKVSHMSLEVYVKTGKIKVEYRGGDINIQGPEGVPIKSSKLKLSNR